VDYFRRKTTPGPAGHQLQILGPRDIVFIGEFGSLGELENKFKEEIHCN